jgi:hypothetical protein
MQQLVKSFEVTELPGTSLMEHRVVGSFDKKTE